MSRCWQPDFATVQLDVSSPGTKTSLLQGQTHIQPAASPIQRQLPSIAQKYRL